MNLPTTELRGELRTTIQEAAAQVITLSLNVNEYLAVRDSLTEYDALCNDVTNLKTIVMEQNLNEWCIEHYIDDEELLNPFSYKFPFDTKILERAGIPLDQARAFILKRIDEMRMAAELKKAFDEEGVFDMEGDVILTDVEAIEVVNEPA